MVVVLVATRYQTIVNWLQDSQHESIKSIGVIKRIGPKVYLYVDTILSFEEINRILRSMIKNHGGAMYVYEIYSVFNGKIDYNAYISVETKLTMKYYQTEHKDITEKEIEDYKKAHLK